MAVRRFNRWVPLPLIALLALPAPGAEHYIQLDTEGAFVFMDSEGVALRVEKMWACRNTGWPASVGAEGYTREQFLGFKERRIADGTWEQWDCREYAGDVIWSRVMLEAQRKMNTAADKSACVPWVPETGQYNREMFESSLCELRAAVVDARQDYTADLVLRLGTVLRMEPPTAPSETQRSEYQAEVIAAAKEKSLLTRQEGCGRTLATLMEWTECRMSARAATVDAAEQSLLRYSELVATLPRAGRLSYFQVQDLQAQAVEVRRFVERAADSPVGEP